MMNIDRTLGPAPLSHDSPWRGLLSYDEADAEYFFGRAREITELVDIVRRAPSTLIYGKSGLGKTSLLQAGLFPELRRLDMLPVGIRLRYDTESLIARQIKDAITTSLDAGDPLTHRPIDGPRPHDDESLWEYLHRDGFALWGPRNRLLTLVLVFDQFEEVFTRGAATPASIDRAAELEAELGALIQNRPPAAIRQLFEDSPHAATDFDLSRQAAKVVASLREDFLANLDPWRARLPALLAQRFRLERLARQQAIDIVLLGGGDLVDTTTAERIVDVAADPDPQRNRFSRSPRASVEPALLSLVCDHLNRERIASGRPTITADLPAHLGAKIIQDFYESAFNQFEPKVRWWIEDHLLTSSGYRQQAAIEDAVDEGISEATIEILEGLHVLRREERDGLARIELTHDRLTGPAFDSRNDRRRRALLDDLSRRERELLRRLRAELADPSNNTLDVVDDAVRAIRAMPEVDASSIEARADRANCLSIAAELLCDAGHLDEARRCAENALRISDDAASPATATDLGAQGAMTRETLSRAQALYVLGVLQYDTGTIRAAEDHLMRATAEARRAREPTPSAEAVRIEARVLLKRGEIESQRCLQKEAKCRYAELLDLVDESGNVARDETELWQVRAMLGMARAMGSSQLAEASSWLARAERVIDDRLSKQPGNQRWAWHKLDVEAAAADLTLPSKRDVNATKRLVAVVDSARVLVEKNSRNLRDQLVLAWYECDAGNVRYPRTSLDEISPYLDAARARCKSLTQDQPHWLALQILARNVEWNVVEQKQSQALNIAPDAEGPERGQLLGVARELAEAILVESEAIVAKDFDRTTAQRNRALCAVLTGRLCGSVNDPDAEASYFRLASTILDAIPAPYAMTRGILEIKVYLHECMAGRSVSAEDVEAAEAAYAKAIDAQCLLVEVDGSVRALDDLSRLARLHSEAANLAAAASHPDAELAHYLAMVATLDRAIEEWGQVTSKRAAPLMPATAASEHGRSLLKERLRFNKLVWERTNAQEKWAMAAAHLSALIEDTLRILRTEPTNSARDSLASLGKDGSTLLVQLSHSSDGDGAGANAVAVARLTAATERIAELSRLLPNYVVVDDVRVVGAPQNWALPPLIPGLWRTLNHDEQAAEIERLRGTEVGAVFGDRVPMRIRTCHLACYDSARFYEAEVSHTDGGAGIVAYIRHADGVVLINGASAQIWAFHQTHPPRLDSPDKVATYLELFVNGLNASSGRFAIIHRIEDLHWDHDTPVWLRDQVARGIGPLIVEATTGGVATASVQYGDALFVAHLTVHPSGIVDMDSDAWIARMLPIDAEYFLNGERVVPPASAHQRLRNLAWRTKRWGDVATEARAWAEAVESGTLGTPVDPDVMTTAYRWLATALLLNGDVAAALAAAEHEIPGMTEVNTRWMRIAHANILLALDRISEAEAEYASGAGTELADGETWEAAVGSDWNLMTENGVAVAAIEKLRNMFHRPPATARDTP